MLRSFIVFMFVFSASVVFAQPQGKNQFFKDIHEFTIPDILKKASGKDVTLMLSNGGSISGTLPKEKINYSGSMTKIVHLQKIVGQDYNDALIVMNTIVAVILRNPDAP